MPGLPNTQTDRVGGTPLEPQSRLDHRICGPALRCCPRLARPGRAGSPGHALRRHRRSAPTGGWCYRIATADRGGRKVYTPVVCVPLPPGVSFDPSRGVTLRVANEAELREAARRSRQAGVRILIDREIVLPGQGLGFYCDGHGMRIEGMGPRQRRSSPGAGQRGGRRQHGPIGLAWAVRQWVESVGAECCRRCRRRVRRMGKRAAAGQR